MNRRNITLFAITIIVIVGLIAAGFAFKYYTSFRNVTIITKQPNLTADIYARNPNSDESNLDTKLGTVKGTKVFSLQPGKYYAVPQDATYDQSQISFTVDTKDLTITVDPGYSEKYLTQKLNQELTAIKNVIATKYASIISGYTINQGKLYLDGTWYGTTIVQRSPGPGQLGDTYRTVLHKVNGTWQIAAIPEIVITAPEHPDIPASILTDLNAQSGY